MIYYIDGVGRFLYEKADWILGRSWAVIIDTYYEGVSDSGPVFHSIMTGKWNPDYNISYKDTDSLFHKLTN